jgi:uncharacterized cupredoxin-like copper-binding protein
MKRSIVVFVGAACFLFTLMASAYAVELTADMVSKEGKITRNGKVYVKGDKVRIEKGSTPLYIIVRNDKGILWQVNNVERTYLEAKLTPDMKPMIEEKFAGETGRKQVGTETVNGYAAKKYTVTVTRGKKAETVTQWYSQEYAFTVKVAGSNWSTEYKNIKKGKVDDSLFELSKDLVKDQQEVPDVLH